MSLSRRTPSRADGVANREKLIHAAESYFAENGLDAPLQGIADAAGVGIGTLYRNFSSHKDLIEALFDRIRGEFSEIERRAAEKESGWESLETVMRESVAFLLENPATAEIMRRQNSNAPGSMPTQAWIQPLEIVVDRARDEGTARGDLTGQDLSAATLALGALQNFRPEDRISLGARMVALMLDGMRAHPHEPSVLPVDGHEIRTA